MQSFLVPAMSYNVPQAGWAPRPGQVQPEASGYPLSESLLSLPEREQAGILRENQDIPG